MSERHHSIDPLADTGAELDAGTRPLGLLPSAASVVGRTCTLTGADGTATVPSPEDDPLIGRYLAHFLVEERIGQGGMGEVYRAIDTGLDRPVAIKVLPAAIAEDAHRRARFFREARAQARIQHVHVCHIYFIGEHEGRLFYAMEYIDGESLAEMVERVGALPMRRAVEICRMAALGLREAHRHGFTHRDIKPSNLMIDKNGVVKVVDFGLVTDAGRAEAQLVAGSVDDNRGGGLTMAGGILGTPLYMAPEQARGEEVDFRADLYALGATLHHLVTGKPPFAGDSVEDILSQHRSDVRPRVGALTNQRRRYAQLDALCDRLMAKEPDDRFESYDALIAAIDDLTPDRARPAGLWARSFAVGIDTIFVGFGTVALEVLGPWGENHGEIWFGVLAALYVIGCHGAWGRTLGKAMLELEVVPTGVAKLSPGQRRGRLGLGRAVVRYAVEWGPVYLAVLALGAVGLALGGDHPVVEIGGGVVAGLAFLRVPIEGLVAVWSDPHKRASWDRVSRTRVRYRRLTG
ncbi:protein kinase domain-containing protein [Haliangium sp.]|uniref:protein kinase domain-containing protein n=1 Tax=Haliangium sp. TaxID=2663208 RepID=UPI003D139876